MTDFTWEIDSDVWHEGGAVAKGWEPFGVDNGRIWFRRKVYREPHVDDTYADGGEDYLPGVGAVEGNLPPGHRFGVPVETRELKPEKIGGFAGPHGEWAETTYGKLELAPEPDSDGVVVIGGKATYYKDGVPIETREIRDGAPVEGTDDWNRENR